MDTREKIKITEYAISHYNQQKREYNIEKLETEQDSAYYKKQIRELAKKGVEILINDDYSSNNIQNIAHKIKDEYLSRLEYTLSDNLATAKLSTRIVYRYHKEEENIYNYKKQIKALDIQLVPYNNVSFQWLNKNKIHKKNSIPLHKVFSKKNIEIRKHIKNVTHTLNTSLEKSIENYNNIIKNKNKIK